MATRRVTRAELIKALSLIGINAANGRGVLAAHQFSKAAITAVDMYGDHCKLNGESNLNNVCLIVELAE